MPTMSKGKSKTSKIGIPPFSEVLSLLSVILGMHYFFSYKLLYGILEIYGISHLPIITLEDLTFCMAKYHISLFAISQYGLFWILIWIIVFPKFKLKKLTKELRKAPNRIRKNWHKYSHFKKIALSASLSICLLGFLFCAGLLIYKFILTFDKIANTISFIIIFITPVMYIFWKKKRVYILFAHLVFVLIWINITTNQALENYRDTDHKTSSIIQFEYDDKIIQSSDSLQYIFHGSAYIILRNAPKGTMHLFRTEAVSDFKILPTH